VTPPDPVAPSLAARAAASATRSPIQRNLWLKSLLASPDALSNPAQLTRLHCS